MRRTGEASGLGGGAAPAAPLSFPALSLVGSINRFFYKPPTTSNKKAKDFWN